MFHPAISFENDSDYRNLENFENSSHAKSDATAGRLPESNSQSQVIDTKPHVLITAANIPMSESDNVVPTYANELERRKLQSIVHTHELRSEKHTDMRKQQDLLTTAPPRESNSIPLPTSAEMMRKSLDRFGSTFHPTPQVAQKALHTGASPQHNSANLNKASTPDI